MYEFHDVALAGHPGAEETSRTIREVFHWPQIQKDTEAHVRRCLICAQCKRHNPTPNAPQRPRQPQEPSETIAVHIMGAYPATSKGNRFLLVVTVIGSSGFRQRLPIPRPPLAKSLQTLAGSALGNRLIHTTGKPNRAEEPGTKETTPCPSEGG